ncbi:helix-turn-helix domain-containing protein [Thauera butanivorans]|uniref:helix-turn-helix domain-containing protein n=1 Tax=Thauera butanivorans TaxID=86174 RepID=UPI003AB47718
MSAAAKPMDAGGPIASTAAPGTTAPFSYTLRDTLDADEHAACLSNWQQQYDQLSAGLFAGEFEEFCFGRVQLFREALNQSVHQAGIAWPGSRTVAVPTVIEGTGWFGGETYSADTMLTLGSSDELDFRTPRRLEIVACTADTTALNTYALQVEHRDLEAELSGRTTVPASPQQMADLGALLTTMMASLRATPDLLRHPQMRTAMEQALFATLLNTLPPAAASPSLAPSCRTRQFIVARAREYMETHIDEPITVADLCVKLGVSRRTLQYSFQDVLDLNPVKFLRAIRLNAVRRALKQAGGNERATVADIAARWGFWHLSHFSADYKAMFGELPSETLRRSG